MRERQLGGENKFWLIWELRAWHTFSGEHELTCGKWQQLAQTRWNHRSSDRWQQKTHTQRSKSKLGQMRRVVVDRTTSHHHQHIESKVDRIDGSNWQWWAEEEEDSRDCPSHSIRASRSRLANRESVNSVAQFGGTNWVSKWWLLRWMLVMKRMIGNDGEDGQRKWLHYSRWIYPWQLLPVGESWELEFFYWAQNAIPLGLDLQKFMPETL